MKWARSRGLHEMHLHNRSRKKKPRLHDTHETLPILCRQHIVPPPPILHRPDHSARERAAAAHERGVDVCGTVTHDMSHILVLRPFLYRSS